MRLPSGLFLAALRLIWFPETARKPIYVTSTVFAKRTKIPFFNVTSLSARRGRLLVCGKNSDALSGRFSKYLVKKGRIITATVL